MLGSLRRKSVSNGVVFFRGSLPPRFAEIAHVEAQGVSIQSDRARDDAAWAATLNHPEWGTAELICPKRVEPAGRAVLDFDPRLNEGDVDAIASCASGIFIRHEGRRENVLRDRKHMLRFARALMGDEGVAVCDLAATCFWTPEALDDELAHDADLDIMSLYVIHAVNDGGEEPVCQWAHTHGLGELGFFDFDILRPSDDVTGRASDIFRSIAFAIVEGDLKADSSAFIVVNPDLAIRMVSAARFSKSAAPKWNELRDDPDGHHHDKRAVVCDASAGGWRSWLGRDIRPCRWLQKPVPENTTIRFSNAASDLMAERSRMTCGVLRKLHEEFAEFEFPTLVKLGYVVDGGGPTDREHLWFEVHAFRENSIDATLINEPWQVSRLKLNDRGEHPIDLISGWTMFTPAGQITPQGFGPARLVRANADRIRELMRESRSEQA